MNRDVQCRPSLRALRCTVAAFALLGAAPVFAQAAQSPAASHSDSAMTNLVRLLVEQKILSPEKGAALLKQAQEEAAEARAATAPTQRADAGDLPPPAPGAVRVPYVPEVVRAQIRDELRTEVLAQAKAERWAAPALAAPGWVNDIRFFGDIRLRSQSQFYSRNNSNLVIDVGEFNSTGPIDLSSPNALVPTINTIRDRNIVQIRARFGMEADVAKRFQLGFRLATGDDNSPISTNAVLGGGFRKRDIWLDRAYVRGALLPGVSIVAGRFENPFRHTDLVFDTDISFDGLAGEIDAGRFIGNGVTLALRGGAFPLDFGDNDFPSTSFNKRNFRSRYLLSGQFQAAKSFQNGIDISLAAAYHDFTYMRGHVSAPCDVYSNPRIICSTDALRPLSPGKGNTLMFLRSFDTSANPDPGSPIEPQYLGLKFAYRLLDVNGSVSLPISNSVKLMAVGDYVHNFGVDPRNLCKEGVDGQPLNNISANSQGLCGPNGSGRFVGGNEGYAGFLYLGHPNLFLGDPRKAQRGDWALSANYRYLQSDAVLDSFTDSDFHLGGTNTKGYTLRGVFAPFNNITLGARWLSSNEIVDQPLSIDVFQFDLGVSF